MSDDLATMFGLSSAVAASAAPEATYGTALTAPSLPPMTDFGDGLYKEMRTSGDTQHTFVCINTHKSSNASVIVTAFMTQAPSGCKDTILDGSFGCLQSTTPQFMPSQTEAKYEAVGDKQIRSDGSARVINTMVLPKEAIRSAMQNVKTPSKFRTSFTNFEVAPQGSTDDFTVQYGVSIVKFHLNPGKRSFPLYGDTFVVNNFVIPDKLPGEADSNGYHAGGSLGVLPFHTLSADDMVVDLSQAKVDVLLLMAEFHGANLCVLANSPAVPLVADQSSKKQHEELITKVTGDPMKRLTDSLKSTLFEPTTTGKAEARAVWMNPDPVTLGRNLGIAAQDAQSCNLGRVSNMVCLTTNTQLVRIGGNTQVVSPVLCAAGQIVKGEFNDPYSDSLIIGTAIYQSAEREFVNAGIARANARNAPKIIELKLEVSLTASQLLQNAIQSGTPSAGISRMYILASLMTHHITAPFGIDLPSLSTAFVCVIKPVLSISIMGNLAQNTNGINMESEKAKDTIKNSRALVKELGVTELDLTTTPENVIVHTEQTLAFALKLSSEYVKSGLGIVGGGDFIPECNGTINDAIEIACAASKAVHDEEQAKWKRASTFKKPPCFKQSNLKFAKDATLSCINQDGATDIRGTVYAFVPGHVAALKENKADTELIETTAFGENVLGCHLGLGGIPGELVGKLQHGAVFLFQKRFASTATGAVKTIAVQDLDQLDFSYLVEDDDTENAQEVSPPGDAETEEAPGASAQQPGKKRAAVRDEKVTGHKQKK